MEPRLCAFERAPCIAVTTDGTPYCAVHRRNPSPEEFQWLAWANYVPKFLPPSEIERRRIARRDAQWWER